MFGVERNVGAQNLSSFDLNVGLILCFLENNATIS
jgi:hypothetical protein